MNLAKPILAAGAAGSMGLAAVKMMGAAIPLTVVALPALVSFSILGLAGIYFAVVRADQ